LPVEFNGLVAWITVTMLVPGLSLLLLAHYGFAQVRDERALVEQRRLKRVGNLLAASACAFYLLLFVMVNVASGGRTMGSMGNPLGAMLVLGYAFLGAPFALIVFVVMLLRYFLRRRAR
jgi:hypothetical protein